MPLGLTRPLGVSVEARDKFDAKDRAQREMGAWPFQEEGDYHFLVLAEREVYDLLVQ